MSLSQRRCLAFVTLCPAREIRRDDNALPKFYRPPLLCTQPTVEHSTTKKIWRSGEGTRMSLEVDRRKFSTMALATFSSHAWTGFCSVEPADAITSPFAAPMDLIARVGQKAPQRPQEKLFEEDIFYPEYFKGVWKTESRLISVTCPAGYKLFGKPGSFEAAQRDLNHALEYPSRFIKVGKHVVSDRPFNVKAIAEASMGDSSVLECLQPRNDANELITNIRPNSAGGEVFVVKIKALARQQQQGPLARPLGEYTNELVSDGPSVVDDDASRQGLYTSEMVRQEVRLNTSNLRVMPLIRDVETTTLFVTKPTDNNYIEAWQKTSSYLTRSSLQYVDTRGRPVDVRWYKLKYTRRA